MVDLLRVVWSGWTRTQN